MRHWRTLLEAMVANEAEEVGRLSLLTAAEREQIVVEWNATQAAFAQDQCIHELFEEQARRNPQGCPQPSAKPVEMWTICCSQNAAISRRAALIGHARAPMFPLAPSTERE